MLKLDYKGVIILNEKIKVASIIDLITFKTNYHCKFKHKYNSKYVHNISWNKRWLS